MEVIFKSFQSLNNTFDIRIFGTTEEPLFSAVDIGNILEYSNIRSTITDYDDSERKVMNIDTKTGSHSSTLLTERGLYRLVHGSRTEIGKQFRNWVFDIIRELRLTGHAKLRNAFAQQKIAHSHA